MRATGQELLARLLVEAGPGSGEECLDTIRVGQPRTDSRWVRIADTSCASGVSDREPGLVDLLYRGHQPQSRTEEEVNLVATSTL